MTGAKAIDAQYGVGKGMASLAAALADANLIYESTSMTAALLGASFEAFILSGEIHAITYRTMRGVEVSEENLGFDDICAPSLETVTSSEWIIPKKRWNATITTPSWQTANNLAHGQKTVCWMHGAAPKRKPTRY